MNNDVVSIPPNYPTSTTTPRPTHPHQTAKGQKNVKNLRSALDEKTRTVIEGLSDEHTDDLLAAKWVEPLQRKLEELPQTAVDELIAAVNALNDKYSTTYSDVCEQIEQAEAKLGNMLGQLTGNEFDMAGIAELKTLLGGE